MKNFTSLRHLLGNALASERASFAFAVVYGDVTGDKMVLTTDRIAVRNMINAHGYDRFYDVNGDGVVDEADFALVTGRVGTGL